MKQPWKCGLTNFKRHSKWPSSNLHRSGHLQKKTAKSKWQSCSRGCPSQDSPQCHQQNSPTSPCSPWLQSPSPACGSLRVCASGSWPYFHGGAEKLQEQDINLRAKDEPSTNNSQNWRVGNLIAGNQCISRLESIVSCRICEFALNKSSEESVTVKDAKLVLSDPGQPGHTSILITSSEIYPHHQFSPQDSGGNHEIRNLPANLVHQLHFDGFLGGLLWISGWFLVSRHTSSGSRLSIKASRSSVTSS